MEKDRCLPFDNPADDDIVIDFLSLEEFLTWVRYPDGTLRFPLDAMEEAELLYLYAQESGKSLGFVDKSLGYFTHNPMNIRPITLCGLVKEAYAENKKRVKVTNELHLTRPLQKRARSERKVLLRLYKKVTDYDKWQKAYATK